MSGTEEVPSVATEAILLIGDAQENGSVTWPPVFWTIHAYKIVSAQFFYCVIDSEQPPAAVPSKLAGKQIPLVQRGCGLTIRHARRPDLVRVAPVRTPVDCFSAGRELLPPRDVQASWLVSRQEILTCCGILVSSEYQSTRTKVVLAVVESFRRACDRFPGFSHRCALPGRALLFLTPFFHSRNLVASGRLEISSLGTRPPKENRPRFSHGIWPKLSNPLQTIANWFAAHPV